MADTVTAEVRSNIMRRVRSKGTKPEMSVRRALHLRGYRYRLHRADLPGRPDLAFPSRRKVLFVNGCFWHAHSGCSRARMPASNREYWIAKLMRNRRRDAENLAQAIKKAAGFKARRWVVERTHSWLNRFRRILVRWDKSPANYIAFLHFACALIALRAAGLLG